VFAYVVRRVLSTVPLLLVGTFLVYTLAASVSNPLAQLATCQTCGEAEYQRVIDLYDLDTPVPLRYVKWVTSAVTGDMGTAPTIGNADVFSIVLTRAAATARLAIPAFIIIALVAIGLGVYQAIRQYSASDYVITGVSFLGIALPTFVFGLLLQALVVTLGQRAGWDFFYVFGLRSGSLRDVVASHTLPVLTLALVLIATESRFMRASMLEVINSDYVRTARSKGVRESVVTRKHTLRNALIPIVTLAALNFSSVFSGAIVTETVFAIPGLGSFFLQALFAREVYSIMAYLLVSSVIVVIGKQNADIQ
jgi:peptide/nickel transport system permease protein